MRIRPQWLVSSSAFALLLICSCLEAQDPVGGTPDVIVPEAAVPKLDGRIDKGEWDKGYAFTVWRQTEKYATGRILRSGRDLYVLVQSPVDAYGLTVRMGFSDPGFRRVMVEVVPLNPPRPPVEIHGFRPDGQQETLSAATCDVRFAFAKDRSFTAEIKLPLDVLEIGRPPKRYEFFLQLFSEIQAKGLAAFPASARSNLDRTKLSSFMPERDWGIYDKNVPAVPNEAIAILETLWRELNGVPRTPAVLSPFLGTRNGHRNDVELAALQARLERLKLAYPEYVSLDGGLVRVFIGRNDLEGALKSLATMAKTAPLLADSDKHVRFRARLLNDLGRFDEAIAVLEKNRELFKREAGVAAALEAAMRAQRDDWNRELRYRAADAKAGDLPRVLLKTNKGDILLELFEDDAPNSVACFIEQVEAKYYDNTRFFWCEASSRAEGGDPLTRNEDEHDDGYGGPERPIETEIGRRLHFPFSVSWVNKRRTHNTEGGNFSIGLVPSPGLNGVRTVFGRVIEGSKVALRLAWYDTIEKATVVRKRDHPYRAVRR